MDFQLQIFLIIGVGGGLIAGLILANALLIYYMSKLYHKVSRESAYRRWETRLSVHTRRRSFPYKLIKNSQKVRGHSTNRCIHLIVFQKPWTGPRRRASQKIHAVHTRSYDDSCTKKWEKNETKQGLSQLAKVSWALTADSLPLINHPLSSLSLRT